MAKSLVERLSEWFEGIGRWSYDHRWTVLVLSLIVLVAFGALATRTRFDNSFEAFFDVGDETYSRYERYREDFGSDEVAYLLYEAPGYEHGPWNIEVMRKIGQLTDALENEVPFVSKVTSLANVEFMEPVEGGIEVYDLLEDFPEDQAALLRVRDQVLAKPLYVGGVVSEDGTHASIVLEMEKSSVDPLDEIRLDPEGGDGIHNLYPQVSNSKIEEILARPEYEGIVFYVTGDVPLNAVYNELVEEETALLTSLTFAVVGLILLAFFRRPVGVLGPIAVVALSLVVTIGTIGLLGWRLDMFFVMMPTLLIAVGVANAVHIVSDFRMHMLASGDRREAVRHTLELVGPPCLLTSLTTAAGFGAMMTAPIPTLSQFGAYSAVGVLAAFLLSVTLLVFFLSIGRRRVTARRGARDAAMRERVLAKGGPVFDRALTAVARFTLRRRREIVSSFGALTLIALAGAFQLVVDSNYLDDLSEELAVRNDTEYADEVMGGTMSYVYLFDTGEPDGIKDPEVLREIERLQARADQEVPVVQKTYSIVDLLRDINQTFHDGDPEYFRLPETRELVAQYLLVYEMSGGDELSQYVSSDLSRAALALRCDWVPTRQLGEMVARLDDHVAEQPVLRSELARTGIADLWMKLMDYITTSQIRGFLLALSVIFLLMSLLYGSLRTGAIAMVPNLFPVAMTLGGMGWLGITLDYTTLLIAPVAIGIAVDDTVHLLTRFRHEFARHGDYEIAFVAAVRDVGRALVITSVVLVCGFLVNLASLNVAQAHFGILLASTIGMALVSDFLLLPALIVMLRPFGAEPPRELAAAADEQPEHEPPLAVRG